MLSFMPEAGNPEFNSILHLNTFYMHDIYIYDLN